MPDTLGPYQIRGELGRGAMAVVWRGYDTRLEREVAIKEPAIPSGTDSAMAAELGARFVREGKAAAKLSHPGIVTIYTADIYEGRPAIVMELIEGQTLADILDTGPLEPASAIAIADQLLDAAGYAHSRGVVHRDIKPDNVFVTHDGRVKLADFGIAHVGQSSALTQAGTVMGTPGYMAPEQVTGSPVDARADIFAIGVILHEMLTGSNPFGATQGTAPTTVMYRIVHEPAAAVPTLILEATNTPIDQVLSAALAKNPAARFENAEAFRSALRAGSVVTGSSAGSAVVGQATGVFEAQAAGSTLPVAAASGTVAHSRMNLTPYVVVGVVGVLIVGALFVLASGGTSTGGSIAGTVVGTQPADEPSAAAADQPADTGATRVAVTASYSPGNDEVEDGTAVTVEARVDNPERVAEVALLVDGRVVDTALEPPYQLRYIAEQGSHTLAVEATDVDGAVWQAEDHSLVVTFREDSEVEIRAVIDEWVDSFRRMDMDAHMACYGSSVTPYFSKPSASNSEIRQDKLRGFDGDYSVFEMYVDNVAMDVLSSDRAVVLLDKTWDTIRTSGSRFAGSEQQRLTFATEGRDWKIVGEEELEIYWVEKE